MSKTMLLTRRKRAKNPIKNVLKFKEHTRKNIRTILNRSIGKTLKNIRKKVAIGNTDGLRKRRNKIQRLVVFKRISV